MVGGHSNELNFPFSDANLGMSYAGFSKLKQEAPASAGLVSRPPWAVPPMSGSAAGKSPFSDLPFIKQQQQQHQQQEMNQHQHQHHQHHHLNPMLGHGGRSSYPELLHAPQAQTAFGIPYEQVSCSSNTSGSMYKSTSSASSSSAYGSFKDRASRHHYPLQYNGGSLVLDHHRGELINLSKMTPQEILDAKALAASKSHSEAERRRRERINNHLNTLRSLLPSTTKTDKASLLAEVIQHVKELKRQAAVIAEGGPVPSDVDELKVDTDASSTDGNLVMKASLCCDDRPDLLTDLTKVLKTLKLKTIKAEIATLGGRVKNVLVIGKDGGGSAPCGAAGTEDGSSSSSSSAGQERPSLNCVQEALRTVIERSNDLSASGYNSGGKRQKLNHQQHQQQQQQQQQQHQQEASY